MPGMNIGLTLWNAKRRSTRSKSSISSISRTPTSPTQVHDGFGLPSPDDPDPFGVRALELAGLAIKEAGSRSRPSSDAFDYRPSPTSPVFRHSTQSIDAAALRDARRDSKRSTLSIDHSTQTANMIPPQFLGDSPSFCNSPPIQEEPNQQETTEETVAEFVSPQPGQDFSETSEVSAVGDALDALVDDQELDVEVAMTSVQIFTRAAASPIESKPKLVNITKRVPPALPVKNPLRQRRVQAVEPIVETDMGDEGFEDDSSSTYSSSPTKSSFDKSEPSPNPWSAQSSIEDSESLWHKDENVPDLDVLPLYDEDDGDSLAESDATHHDGPQRSQVRAGLASYVMGDYANASGETLAISVQAADSLSVNEDKERKPVAEMGNGSRQSLTHMVPEARAHDSTDISDDIASLSSLYEEDASSPPEKETFHSASSLPLPSTKPMPNTQQETIATI
ncbi:MAG: hypothetical protein LQ340_005708 [Diploschistes diacapsis]|nr:MAG: hypothetical protein LQ340_005708 [Diploschistes diacapsis]